MSILSSATHVIFSQSKEIAGLNAKRSHILELLSAYLNFKSHAALTHSVSQNEAIIHAISHPEEAFKKLLLRANVLQLNCSTLFILKPIIESEIQRLTNDKTDLYLIMDLLGLRLSNKAYNPSKVDLEIDENLFKRLSYQAKNGNEEAHLVISLWHASKNATDKYVEDEDNDEDNEGSEYWYKQKLAGIDLAAHTLLWTNNYERELQIDDAVTLSYSSFEVTSLAKPAVFKTIQKNIPINFCWELDSLTVLRLLTSITAVDEDFDSYSYEQLNADEQIHREILLDWLMLSMIQTPNKHGLMDLIEQLSEPEMQWAWYYYGLSVQMDVTKSEHIAINADTGGENVGYGPIEVGGTDGLELLKIEPGAQEKAMSLSKKIIKQHSKFLIPHD